MATKEQWEIFKYLFESEQERKQKLSNIGKVYVSLSMLYVGALGMKVEFWYKELPKDTLLVVLFLLVLITFLVALCLTVFALGIYKYEYLNDPEELIKKFGNHAPSNEEFFDDRIVDLAVATNRNKNQNDKRSIFLKYSMYTMVGGVLLHIVLLVSVLY